MYAERDKVDDGCRSGDIEGSGGDLEGSGGDARPSTRHAAIVRGGASAFRRRLGHQTGRDSIVRNGSCSDNPDDIFCFWVVYWDGYVEPIFSR